MSILRNAGILAPVPDSFDFDKQMESRDLLPPAGLALKIRNRDNCLVEIHNDQSCYETVSCRRDRVAQADVGALLKPLWGYEDEEMDDMISSETYCTAVGPLPVFLRAVVERTRSFKLAEAEKQKGQDKVKSGSARPLAGSMVMENPTRRLPGQRQTVVIPDVYLQSIIHKATVPLSWFSDERLHTAMHYPGSIHVRDYRPPPTAAFPASAKVSIFQMEEMTKIWGNDDVASCMTPLAWRQASENHVAALDILCPKPVAGQLSVIAPTYAGEMQSHYDFFYRLQDFESTFQEWYPFEKKSRLEIMTGSLFDAAHYAGRVNSILDANRALERFGMTKRSLPSAGGDLGSIKAPRNSSSSSPGQFFRSAEPQPSTAGSPMVCVSCAAGHTLRNHPTSVTTFIDGKPLFCAMRDGEFWTAKAVNGRFRCICINFNLPQGCKGSHGEAEKAHICSFCGGSHAALSRHPTCARVSDGKIRP
jgi:hypothetical protein